MFSVADSGENRDMAFQENEGGTGGSGLLLVLDRFPHKSERIERLFQRSLSFQSLCEEYRECLRALRHWRKRTSREASVRKAEYSALFEELEQEILQYLEPDELHD